MFNLYFKRLPKYCKHILINNKHFNKGIVLIQLNLALYTTNITDSNSKLVSAESSSNNKFWERVMDGPIPKDIFKNTRDRYDGITVDTSKSNEIFLNETEFSKNLEKSLEYWNKTNCKTVWFKVNVKHSSIVPILAKNGFNFHHAREGFVMMYKWLPIDLTANIPPYSHTMIGVGGLVVNEKNQILTVTEKHSIIKNSWKLPGGYVEPEENLVDAVVREIFEETGIKTKFDSIISLRHSHGFNFDCSDIYIVMSLTPESDDNISICPREIAQSKWMEFDEYLNHPNVHEFNRSLLKTYMRYKEEGIRIDVVDAELNLQKFKRKYQMYSVTPRL